MSFLYQQRPSKTLRLLAWEGRLVLAATCFALVGCGDAADTDSSRPATAAAEELNLGPADQFLFWPPDQQIEGYRNIEEIFPTRTIEAGVQPYPLVSNPQDFSDVSYELDGETFTVDEAIEQRRIAGLLVAREGQILLERYSLGNTEDSRWISFSIAKSVVSMLIGAAIQDGYIESVDDPITRYLPGLEGGAYDGVSVKNVLQMSSGVAWNEDYADPESDVNNMPQGNLPFLRHMGSMARTDKAPGEVFNYNTGETNLAGSVLRGALGNNLSTYLSHKIWKPFGMEADATWMLHEEAGGELGGCCISATLRDYARLGVFAMGDGKLPGGASVLPEDWMSDSIKPSKGSEGYGYLWWLLGDGDFAGIGIFGQLIFMDPETETVIVTHSAWPTAVGQDLSQHRAALMSALSKAAANAPLE